LRFPPFSLPAACKILVCRRDTHTHFCTHNTRRQNLDDAFAKLQAMIDKAVEAITPKEVNPETVKKVKQKWVALPKCGTFELAGAVICLSASEERGLS